MEQNDHLSLKRALEAAKRDLEAEYRRKAKVLDAALAIVEEIGPDLRPADMARLMPEESEAPPTAETTLAEIDTEREGSTEKQPDAEQEPDSGQEPDMTQENMWKDEPPTSNGEPQSFKLIREIRAAIRDMKGHTFEQKDITSMISKKYPEKTVLPGSVSTALGKMAKQGEIKLIKASHGGADPALYREGSMSP